MSLMLHRIGLLRPTLASPDTVPDAFEVEDWSLAPGHEQADVTIHALPNDGGATITDVEYRLDGGSWVSSGGASSFTISGLTNDHEYDVELRAVNDVGAGAAGDTKSVTPEDDAPAWTPSSLPGLLAYWDISDLSSLFQERSGGGSTPATLNGVVGTVRDLSGVGRHLEAPSDAARPILRQDGGGKYYLEFDGADDRMHSSGYTKAQPWVRLSALDFASIVSSRQLLANSGGNSSGPGALYFSSGTQLSIWSGNALIVGTVSANSPRVITERHSGASSRVAINNSSYATGNAGTTAAAGMTVACGVINTGPTYGAHSALRLYALIDSDDDLGDADIALARTWLGNRVGLSL